RVGLAAHAGRRRAREIARPDHLVERALVIVLDLPLDRLVFDHEKAPTLCVAAVRRADARFQDFSNQRVGDGIRLQPSHRARRVRDLENAVRVGHERSSLPGAYSRRRGDARGCAWAAFGMPGVCIVRRLSALVVQRALAVGPDALPVGPDALAVGPDALPVGPDALPVGPDALATGVSDFSLLTTISVRARRSCAVGR